MLETIKIEDGRIRNLEYHNRRFNASRKALFGGSGRVIGGENRGDLAGGGTLPEADLAALIRVPPDLGPGIFRCRVLYGKEIGKVEFLPYRSRPVQSLKMVTADRLEYSLKYADRSQLESLFAMRENCDEILIVKNGLITDTSVSNIAFRRRDGSWVTPDAPLLNGTMRMYLLETGRITGAAIRPGDLPAFTEARMINCMMDLDGGPQIGIDRIMD